MSCHLKPFVYCACEKYIGCKKFKTEENIMNNSILSAYSNVYSTALMQNVKPTTAIATAKKVREGRFSDLVRLLRLA